MATPEAVAVPTSASIQAGLDQLEAAIKEAHDVVSGIAAASADEGTAPAEEGAEACLSRCQGEMQSLIARLAGLRDRVGRL